MKKSIGRYGLILGVVLLGIAALGESRTAGAFTLHNFQTGYCLAVQGATIAPVTAGTGIIVWPCNNTNSQQWNFGPVTANGGLGTEATTLQSEIQIGPNCRGCFDVTGVIGVSGGNMVGGTPLILWTQDPLFPDPFSTAQQVNNQGWSFVFQLSDANGHPCYEIGNAGALDGNWVMGLGASSVQGSPVVIVNLGPFPPASSQLWCSY